MAKKSSGARRKPHSGGEALDATATSFVAGFLRLLQAQVAYYRTSGALMYLNTPIKNAGEDVDPKRTALERISGVTYLQYDCYQYITQLSYLIYLTTLLDTFLTDVTKLLLLCFPQSLGAERKVDLKLVLGSQSRSQIINEAAKKRVTEISYLGLIERIGFLNDTFGLEIELNDSDENVLEHFADLRNSAIHDQGFFDVYLNSRGTLKVRQRRCARHPTPIDTEELRKAEQAYTRLVATIYDAIARKVFKSNASEKFRDLYGSLTDNLKKVPAQVPTSNSDK